jgi:hypothetical protein
MSKDYLVFVESCDYFDVTADSEDQAKREAVEIFKSNPHDAAFEATVMREQDSEDNDTFLVREVESA